MKQRLIPVILLMLCMGSALGAAAAPQLSLDPVSVVQGQTAALDLRLTGGTEPYAGVNATLLLPDGITVNGIATQPGFTGDFHPIADPDENRTATIAYSVSETFNSPESVLLTLEFQVAADLLSAVYPVQFMTSGLSNATGTVSVEHTTLNGTIAVGIIFVDAAASGANNGSSWTDAYTDLQSALSAAISDSEIWVAAGTYTPSTKYGGTGNRYRAFQLKNGVGIYGGFAGDETIREQRNCRHNVTILSGDIGASGVTSDNCYHVFYHPNGLGLDSTALLDGFTITGGNANGSSWPANSGGGMLNVSSSPTLTNCRFSGNSAVNGGGMANYSSSSVLSNSSFFDNSASNGGGMFNYSFSSPVLTNCTFSLNSTTLNGGGMYNFSSAPTLINSILWGDSAATGNEIFNDGSSSPSVTYCDVQGGYSGMGNIDDDPLFADQAIGDFHLRFNSPCIDAGDNTASTLPTTDFEGDDRIIDGNGDGIPFVDMGLDEAAFTCITPAGGTAESSDGSASVEFPSEAISEDLHKVFVSIIMVDEPVPPQSGGFQLLGAVYDFQACNDAGNPVTTFDQPLTLTFHYDPADLDGLDEHSLTINYYDDVLLSWVPILPSTVNTDTHTVTGSTDHFTWFGIFGSESEPIPEPGTFTLVGFGVVLGLLALARRRRKMKK